MAKDTHFSFGDEKAPPAMQERRLGTRFSRRATLRILRPFRGGASLPYSNEALSISLNSEESFWIWDVPTDHLHLSKGACRSFLTSPQAAPKTMSVFLERYFTPAHRAALHKARAPLLCRSGHSLLQTTYHFGDVLIREQCSVLRRNVRGAAVLVMGCCEVLQTPEQHMAGHALNISATGYWTCVPAEQRLLLDAQCRNILGYAAVPDYISFSDIRARIHPEDTERLSLLHPQAIRLPEHGDAIEDIFRTQRNDGQYVKVLLQGAVLERASDGTALRLAGSIQDADTLSYIQGQGYQEAERLFQVLKVAGGGLWDWNTVTGEVHYSSSYLVMLGYAPDDFPPTMKSWADRVHPDDYEATVQRQLDIIESPQNGDSFECTFRFLWADGVYRWMMGRGTVTHRDSSGRGTRVVGLHTDISQMQEDREKLEWLVKNDSLTGLRSRDFCNIEMNRIENHCIRPLSIIYCDLNGLKLINDHLGHSMGDTLLRETADVLRHTVRSTDCIARVGGDEFVILLPACPKAKAKEILYEIEQTFEKRNAEPGSMPLLLSLGLASTDNSVVSATMLLQEADAAMRRNKAKARAASRQRIKRWMEETWGICVCLEDARIMDKDDLEVTAAGT